MADTEASPAADAANDILNDQSKKMRWSTRLLVLCTGIMLATVVCARFGHAEIEDTTGFGMDVVNFFSLLAIAFIWLLWVVWIAALSRWRWLKSRRRSPPEPDDPVRVSSSVRGTSITIGNTACGR